MINELFNEIKAIKDTINQLKDDSLNNLNSHKLQEEQIFSDIRREIEELRNEIRQINQNSIPGLIEQFHSENENAFQTINNETRSRMDNFEEKIRSINQELQALNENQRTKVSLDELTGLNQKLDILEENQRTKVSLDELTRFQQNLQIQQGINQNEKEMIQNELLHLKQNVNNIKKDILYLDINKNLYGTSWKVTDDLYINGLLKTQEFTNEISQFEEFDIEIKYPSSNFNEIYEQALKLKSLNVTKLKISIFITENCHQFFKENHYINSIKFDESITSIEGHAFEGCSSLLSVLIPSSVKSIGEWAFRNCWSLSSVSIPSSVTSIGNSAFDECSSLISISIFSSIATIEGWTFSKCSSLSSISIPSSVKSIESYAFEECSSLLCVSIPSSVTYIGNYAFEGCSSLLCVSIPSSVTSIENNAFEGCSSLLSISIPSFINISNIGISNGTKVTRI